MMRLGTRWTSGDDLPASVPASLHAAIAEVDAAAAAESPRPRWTLTWLEGRPVAELETGAVITVGPDGVPVIGEVDDEDY